MAFRRKDFKDCFKFNLRITSTRTLYAVYQQKERNEVSWHMFNLLLQTNFGFPDGEDAQGEPGYQLEFEPAPKNHTVPPTRGMRKM